MHHQVIRRHVVQGSVLKLFFARGTLFLPARHRSGMIVEVPQRTCQYSLHTLGETVVFIYYPDQQIHNLYIFVNNVLYIVSTPTCFDASALSSGSLILLLC
jgi:hypothetical protein